LHRALAGTPRLQSFVDTYDLYVQVAAFIGFSFAVTNGYIWNSRWTFPRVDSGQAPPTVRALRSGKHCRFDSESNHSLRGQRYSDGGTPEAEKGWEPLIAFGIATGM
jgi:hypothetical protein